MLTACVAKIADRSHDGAVAVLATEEPYGALGEILSWISILDMPMRGWPSAMRCG